MDKRLLALPNVNGDLDRVNQRGYWQPVDAEADSTANWVANTAITDILNTMSVRKAIVIADSCYSGSLTRSMLARLDAGDLILEPVGIDRVGRRVRVRGIEASRFHPEPEPPEATRVGEGASATVILRSTTD